MTIDATKLQSQFLDCLFSPEEIIDGKPPVDAVIVEGVIRKYGLHPQRMESHRSEVQVWLAALPHEFRSKEGGGWSFLKACMDEDGNQWGEHVSMEQLFVLGMGLRLAKCLLPREMWSVLPGGMPYYSVL